jgi:pteridine reductase
LGSVCNLEGFSTLSDSLTYQTALVTGGAKRIGKAVCLALARRGLNIALHYGKSVEAAEQTVAEIRDLGVTCELFQCDLNDLGQVSGLIKTVFNQMGQCQILVNSASLFLRGTFQETSLSFLEDHLTINFKSPFLLIQQFSEYAAKGLIINLLDTKITRSSEHFFAYTLSKKMLYELTRMSAKVLGPDIRVNGICPGIILPSSQTSDEVLNHLIQKLPLERKGNPGHIVQAVNYLIENDFVTGECLFVDGGESID